ncbi:MAG: bifunctional diaminohydroxyphosphoribosylaminopyrimidine deaminase/5-amino-6-(5-phosphoribosylamino)uracil reductase RibD [Planctomycetota bacterium]
MCDHEAFMDEAIALARRGIGLVEPNPMVGAVIVRDGRIIGRGWTQPYGGDHAEVHALAAAADAVGAAMYVTLEPCCHYGKTPPCTDAIITAGITRVVVAVVDPFDQVAGQGIARLRDAGVEVITGVREPKVRRQLSAYLKLQLDARPWVILKWAQTLDGRVATRTGDSRWVSGEASRARVHEVRGWCDGIAVGAGTVVADDPLLTNRSGRGRTPTRVVLDDRLATPADAQLIRTIDAAPVLVATTHDALAARRDHADALAAAGAEMLPLPACPEGVDPDALLAEFGRRRWTRLLVEGGPGVAGSLLRAGAVDELWVFLAPRLMGGREGLPAVGGEEIDHLADGMMLPAPSVETLGGDLLLTYRLNER